MNIYGFEPCPFCGSDKVQIMYGLQGEVMGIYCRNCKLMAKWPNLPVLPKGREPFGTVSDAWKARWNQRGGQK